MEEWLERAGPAIARALPNVGISGDRYLQLTMTAVKNSASLMKCTPVSVAVAAVQAAATGLLPNTPLGHASLIPRRVRGALVANLQVEYKGWLQMLNRTNEVVSPGWSIVYKNETFRLRPADRVKIIHEPIEDPAARGDIRGAYFAAWSREGGGEAGGQFGHYMTIAEILAIRDRYSESWRAFKAGRIKDTPWDPANPQAFGWMVIKTVIIQSVKRAPLTTELGKVVAATAARQELQDEGKMKRLAAEFFESVDVEAMPDDDLPYEEPAEAPGSGIGDELAEFRAAVKEWPADARAAWENAHRNRESCSGPGCPICRWPAQPPHPHVPVRKGMLACEACGMGPLWHRKFAPRGGR